MEITLWLVLYAIRFPRNGLMVSYKLMHQHLNQTLAAALQGKGEKTQIIHSPLLPSLTIQNVIFYYKKLNFYKPGEHLMGPSNTFSVLLCRL